MILISYHKSNFFSDSVNQTIKKVTLFLISPKCIFQRSPWKRPKLQIGNGQIWNWHAWFTLSQHCNRFYSEMYLEVHYIFPNIYWSNTNSHYNQFLALQSCRHYSWEFKKYHIFCTNVVVQMHLHIVKTIFNKYLWYLSILKLEFFKDNHPQIV